MPITVPDLARFKREGRRFVMLTAYDYPTASILDAVGVPVIFVGDTLGQVVLGLETTVPVTLEDMLHHIRAVHRAVKNALLVGDLPFGTYGVSIEDSIRCAGRLMQDGQVNVVKLEGAHAPLVSELVARGIPVMGHLGYTPQSVHSFGGPRVQGRTPNAAQALIKSAQQLQDAGACSLVLEAVPTAVAKQISETLSIPTIGIGAGPFCDAQVLVISDLLGLGTRNLKRVPRFVKQYANLDATIADAVTSFVRDVETGNFPDAAHSYE